MAGEIVWSVVLVLEPQAIGIVRGLKKKELCVSCHMTKRYKNWCELLFVTFSDLWNEGSHHCHKAFSLCSSTSHAYCIAG